VLAKAPDTPIDNCRVGAIVETDAFEIRDARGQHDRASAVLAALPELDARAATTTTDDRTRRRHADLARRRNRIG
jgi:hypothetical protein